MNGETAENRVFIRSLTALAKSIVSNIDLMAYLEGGTNFKSADEHLKCLYLSAEGRAAINSSYVTGRFLRFRKLHSSLTDEALEHRLAWAISGLGHGRYVEMRSRFDDPAKCLIPLLMRLAEAFLCEARDGSLRVRSCYLSDWQDLILVVPPLLISSAWMALQPGALGETISDRKVFQRRVQSWLCDSTLPADDDPFLDQLCRVQGLDETHMHLNGSTEADKVWIDALRKPSNVVGAISGVVGREEGLHTAIGNGVSRLLRQEDRNLTSNLLRERVANAIALKAMLLETSIPARNSTTPSDMSPVARYAKAVRNRPAEKGLSATTAEALQLIDIIASLSEGGSSDYRGVAFLWYTLIRAQFCRLLVQQAEQTGFDQFQYITFNELREATEKDFAERFRQIERGFQQPVDFLEGRFAPKTTPDGNASRLIHILRGYLQFLDETPDGISRGKLTRILSSPEQSPLSLSELLRLVHSFESGEVENGLETVTPSERRLRLGLVAHFIKRTDVEERDRFLSCAELRPVCRDSKARREADQAARALIVLINKTVGLSNIIRGVDAASNERHAGPEVFSQVFRRLRRAGIKRFTYHVGEDFVHVASGLRAINEAVLFLGLSAGCRIGHGTAAGLIPAKWWSSIGDSLIQPVEDRLDDLVYAWGALLHQGVLLDRLPMLDLEIRRLSMGIWQDPSVTADLLWRAWQLRRLDPIVRVYGKYDVDLDRDSEIQMFQNAKLQDPDAHSLFLRRHGVGVSGDVLQRSRKPILVAREADVLDVEVIEALQSSTLNLLRERRVAIETLPSSNVRISIHQSYEDHHALRWLGVGQNSGLASVVVGSDDPGIFATSLRMEYAHLLRALEANGAGLEATAILERINSTSKRFRF